MYTSVALLTLAGLLQVAPPVQGLSWSNDYSQAMKQGTEEAKPLAVFVGSGAKGFQQILKEGSLSEAATKVLRDNYVAVYIDISTAKGKKLAQTLEINQGKGLVISDRSCQLQAFWHDGTLAEKDLVQHLRRFADPAVRVQGTLTAATASDNARTSYYPPVQAGSYGGFVGRGC